MPKSPAGEAFAAGGNGEACASAPAPAAPKRGLLLGAACSSLQPLLLSALMLPATAYVIRTLGATDYGQWSMATALVAATMFLTNLGLRGTFVRAVARQPELAASMMAEQLALRAALSLVAAAVGLGACVLLGYSHTVLLCAALAALALVVNTIAVTASDVLQAMQRLPVVAAVQMAAGLVLTAASVLVAWAGGGPVGVAASYVIGPVVSAVLMLSIVHRQHFPLRLRWDTRRSGRLLWEARYKAAHQLMDSTSDRAESLIVPPLVGPMMFGFFSAGTLLATRAMALPEGLCSAAYPALVDAYRRGAQPALRRWGKFMAVMMVACLPAVIVVSFLAGPIAQLLFPGRAETCEQVMRITIWLLPVMGLEYMVGVGLGALQKDAEQAKASIVAGACNLVLTAALVWQFGLLGACWSMVLRYAVQLAVLTPCLVRTLRQLMAEMSASATAPVAAGGGTGGLLS